MRAIAEYRKFAEECDRLANEALIERHRKILREMAAAWRTVADEAERKGKSG
jgi:hypothetical protein